jgi:hypothetical protein
LAQEQRFAVPAMYSGTSAGLHSSVDIHGSSKMTDAVVGTSRCGRCILLGVGGVGASGTSAGLQSGVDVALGVLAGCLTGIARSGAGCVVLPFA